MLSEDSREQLFVRGFYVAEWHVQPSQNRVTRGEETTRLEPKVMEVLLCLARRDGQTVTKERFMEEVWGETIVTNDVLARCISELRKVLGDDARNPSYIETIRKTGYRLIASVSLASASEPARPEVAEAPRRALPVKAEPLSPPGHHLPAWRRPLWSALHRFYVRLRPVPLWSLALVVVLCVASGTAWLQYTFPVELPTPPEMVPFTSFPGEEFDPALSPDGERVAFVWDGADGENYDIYVKQAGASTPLRITEHPAEESSPAWSPAGDRLAFVRTTDEVSSVIIVPAIGGSERTVARFDSGGVRSLVWSPDGATLALSARRAPYESYSIFLLSVETHDTRRLTDPPAYYRGDFDPAFSPDGQKIAFTRSVFERIEDLYIIPVEGGTPRRLTHDRTDVAGLDWSADGKSIIFASNREGPSQLWRIPAAGGTPEWLAASGGAGNLHQPSIARHGERMTLTQRSVDTNIWTLRPLRGYGRFTSHVQILSTWWDSNPDVAPDGEHVVFSSKRSGDFEIWKSRRDGTEPVQLTDMQGSFTSTPRFSPDGEHIVFVSRSEENADIYVMDAAGGTPRPLTDTTAHDVAPSWSQNGEWIYFASNRSGEWQVWRVQAEGGRVQQVTQDGGFAAFEGPDGEALYFTKSNAPGIWKLPFDGSGEATRVVEHLEPYDWGNWAVTEYGIYFIRRDTERPLLACYSFPSDRTFRVAYLEGEVPRHPSLAVAPGAQWFLYAKVDRSESDIVLVENFQ